MKNDWIIDFAIGIGLVAGIIGLCAFIFYLGYASKEQESEQQQSALLLQCQKER